MAEFQTSLASELESELKKGGAEFVFFTNISQLPFAQSRGYPNAIIMGVTLSPEYIEIMSLKPDDVHPSDNNSRIGEDEFNAKEDKMDKLADHLAYVLGNKGYKAYSQSEDNLIMTGAYQEETKESPLPHKTIAGLAGMGWIGKHNLLVNPEFGSAFSMCTVLSDAPLKSVLVSPVSSQCGDCTVCVNICPEGAITGKTWTPGISRDALVNVYSCSACLKCLVLCPWSQNYADSSKPKSNS